MPSAVTMDIQAAPGRACLLPNARKLSLPVLLLMLLPAVALLLQVRDAGNLLTRAGLALPTVDLDTFVMHYSSAVSASAAWLLLPADLVSTVQFSRVSKPCAAQHRTVTVTACTAIVCVQAYVWSPCHFTGIIQVSVAPSCKLACHAVTDSFCCTICDATCRLAWSTT
jgi:hypothetical protein